MLFSAIPRTDPAEAAPQTLMMVFTLVGLDSWREDQVVTEGATESRIWMGTSLYADRVHLQRNTFLFQFVSAAGGKFIP